MSVLAVKDPLRESRDADLVLVWFGSGSSRSPAVCIRGAPIVRRHFYYYSVSFVTLR